jgi:hypothetical protein
MTTPDRLVTFDNNVLIDLRKDIEPTATYARQLLDFNREGKITVSTTISTMLEKQRAGEEMSIQEYIAWLQKIGFASEHIFIGPRTVAFNEQGVITWDIEREFALNQCIHYAMFPNIPFHWREYLDQQCTKLGIVGTRKEALIELDKKSFPTFRILLKHRNNGLHPHSIHWSKMRRRHYPFSMRTSIIGGEMQRMMQWVSTTISPTRFIQPTRINRSSSPVTRGIFSTKLRQFVDVAFVVKSYGQSMHYLH